MGSETVGKEDKSDKYIFVHSSTVQYLIIWVYIFSEEKEEEEESKTCTPEIDDEGYRIQPTGQWSVEKGNFFSSSDSGC